MSANNPFKSTPPDLWFAPAGTSGKGFTRGQIITPVMGPTGGGKSMLTVNTIDDVIKQIKQVRQTTQTSLKSVITAVQKQSANVFTFDMESDMNDMHIGDKSSMNDLWKRLRMQFKDCHPPSEFESYMTDLANYLDRAKRIFDCRSPLRKYTTGHTLHGENNLSAIRIRSSDAVFYYRSEYHRDYQSEYSVAFLKIGDVAFPLITPKSNGAESSAFSDAFSTEFNNLEELSFQRLMEEIGEFYEDYAEDFGIKDA